MRTEVIIKDEKNTGKLIKVLQKAMPEIAAVGVFKLLRKGKIRINDRKVKDHNAMIALGDVISIDGAANPLSKASAGSRVFQPDVLFEDECLYVINKPRGIAVHSGAGKTDRNLIDLLNDRPGNNSQLFLVHRLDKDTSGVLILAKSRQIAGKLQDIIKSDDKKRVSKYYTAIVLGKLPLNGMCDTPIDGKPAKTIFRKTGYRVCERNIMSRADIEIKTGRKHQIRRHLAEIGYPVAGDDDYGNWEENKAFYATFRVKGVVLHCRQIRFFHPVSEMMIEVTAPEPPEFQAVMGAGSEDSPRRSRRTQREEKKKRD